MALRINQFCFCASVRAGAIVAAIINTISVVSSVANGIMFLNAANYAQNHKDYHEAESSLRAFAGVYLTEAILGFIVLVFLILAINKSRASFLVPWLVVYAIIIVLTAIITIYGMTQAFDGSLIVALLIHCFMIYVWLAVYSFYQDLNEGVSATTTNQPGRVI